MNGNGTITRSSPAQIAFANVAHFIATEAGRPLAFLFALTIVIIWAATGPIFHYSDSWLLVINTGTSIVTALMVFLIQNSQNRHSAALQVKLDELIRVSEAKNFFVGIEQLTEDEIRQVQDIVKRRSPNTRE
jgi:low affinity Fe/Cu permease